MKLLEMDIKALDYLWNIISLCWISHCTEKAKSIASNFYDLPLEFPLAIEELVVDFSVTGDQFTIDKLALLLARGRTYDAEHHVILIAFLVKRDFIAINEAAKLLSSIDTSMLDSKNSGQILRVKDVAWLVNEDAKDSIMEANNDLLLEQALESVVNAATS